MASDEASGFSRCGPKSPPRRGPARPIRDPVDGLEIRVTYRTLLVLSRIAEHPGASNREIAARAGISDQGQISKLLTRLEKHGLIENVGLGHTKGEPNAWTLTPKGDQIQHTIDTTHKTED